MPTIEGGSPEQRFRVPQELGQIFWTSALSLIVTEVLRWSGFATRGQDGLGEHDQQQNPWQKRDHNWMQLLLPRLCFRSNLTPDWSAALESCITTLENSMDWCGFFP